MTVKRNEKLIRIPTGFRGEVEIRKDTFNAEDRTVEVCWSTGAKVKRYSWDEGYYMEELLVDKSAIRLDRFGAMSLLDTHEMWSMDSRLGTVVPGSIRIESGKAYARLKLSRKQRGEELFQDLQDGHPLPISVGYKIHRYEKTEGADGQLPTLRAIDWEPIELSAVPVPADPGAISLSRSEPTGNDFYTVLVRQDEPTSAAPAASKKEPTMNKRNAAKTFTGEQLDALALGAGMTRKEGESDDALRTRLISAYDAEDRAAEEAEKRASEEAKRVADEEVTRRAAGAVTAPVPPGQTEAITPAQVQEHLRAAMQANQARIDGIEDVARAANIKLDEDLVRTAVRDHGVTIEAFRSKVLDHMIAKQSQAPTFPHIEARGQDAQETMRRMVANAILHRQGVVAKLEDGAREWRSLGSMDMVKEIMRARGENYRGSPHEVAQRALQTTSDFPLILQDVIRTTLLAAYQGHSNTFQMFATKTLLTDYRESRVLDIGSAPDLLLKNEHGEFVAGTLRESDETMKLQRYGRTLGFTHELLVNDHLSAFMNAVSNWGIKVAKLEGDIVWGAIIGNMKMKDGKGLYHPDHKNLAPSGTALDVTNLKAARLAFRTQKDIDGEAISITPKYLFTGSSLEIDAQTLITALTVPTQIGEVIPQAIKSLVPVYEYRLDKIATKAWLLFAEASATMGRGIHYLHLLGHEAPTTNEQIGFRIEGVEYSIAHSFGVGLSDHRFTYKNPGL